MKTARGCVQRASGGARPCITMILAKWLTSLCSGVPIHSSCAAACCSVHADGGALVAKDTGKAAAAATTAAAAVGRAAVAAAAAAAGSRTGMEMEASGPAVDAAVQGDCGEASACRGKGCGDIGVGRGARVGHVCGEDWGDRGTGIMCVCTGAVRLSTDFTTCWTLQKLIHAPRSPWCHIVLMCVHCLPPGTSSALSVSLTTHHPPPAAAAAAHSLRTWSMYETA